MDKTRSKLNLFTVINDISFDKKNIAKENFKEFNEFLTIRFFSYFPDTLFVANELNKCQQLSKNDKYDYLFHGITRRKRFTKWAKNKKHDDIVMIQKYYDYNYRRASEAYRILSKEDLKMIKESLFEGGLK